MVIWHNSVLQAELTNKDLWDKRIHWWSCNPISVPILFTDFYVNTKAPLLDNYFTSHSLNLYSQQLVSLIEETGIKFEIFPARLVDKKTKNVASDQYQLFHLLYERNGLDLALCKIEGTKIQQLTINKTVEEEQIPIFRLTELGHLVLISQKFKETLERQKISGCRYTPISEYQLI
jgi:hypothetical protein